MKNELYNIAPDGLCMMYTAEQIREAAQDGRKMFLNLGRNHDPAPVRLAATVRGWCTVVLEKGGIIQAWAGDLTARI